MLLQRYSVIIRRAGTRCLSSAGEGTKHFKLLIAGGGTGGCSIASRFTKTLGEGNVAVIEDAKMHYYQPLWTLVGAGTKSLDQSAIKMADALPNKVTWIQDRVAQFDPDNNSVRTEAGKKFTYDYLVVSLGVKLNFDWIKGLPEAFDQDPQICSNYCPETVSKTHPAMENFKGGNAIFTYPNTPVKCAGAPQKVMYLFEDYLTRHNKREGVNIEYFTSSNIMFTAPKYAAILWEMSKTRGVKVNFRHHLIEVIPDKREAIFENLDTKEKKTVPYDFLHVTPPMSPVDCLKNSPLCDETGFVSVNKETLRHTRFPNVFALGDCSNLPTSKTGAAVASQSGILYKNLSDVMDGKEGKRAAYNGYTSCPLVTRINRCILAEFDYTLEPCETFPVDQGKERWTAYLLKAHVMPQIYWLALLKGLWSGPGLFRKLFSLGMKK